MWKRNTSGGGLWPWLVALGSVGALDWLLTRLLVEKSHAVEANPIAARILEQYGWLGLALFKVSNVFLVSVLGHVIARKNQAAARRLLQFACACTLVIIGYSFFLMIHQEIASAHHIEKENQRVARFLQQRQRFLKYIKKVDELSRQLIEDNRHLAHAVQDLVLFITKIDNPSMGTLGLVGEGPNLEERLAAHLVRHAGFLLKNQPEAALRILARFQNEFASSFSSPTLPARALDWYPQPETIPEAADKRFASRER